MESLQQFWNLPPAGLFLQLNSSLDGLTENEAKKRLDEQRKQHKVKAPWHVDFLLLAAQFKSPLVLLLVFAVIISLALGEYPNSFIILTILLATGILGFIQERKAGKAIQKLQELVRSKALVRRERNEKEILIDEVVQGDIVLLNAGDIIPADSLIFEANDLHINESALTGESFPIEKFSGECAAQIISRATNAVFKGTSVVNGTAVILAVHTGINTELGKIAGSLEQSAAPSSFEKGIMQFGYLLMRLTIIFTGLILVLNIIFERPFIESLLFSLALTLGLSPELLPAILTITLSAGAKRMAAKKVIVKKLSAIQNLGAVDVLCSDKTGTITEGIMRLDSALDIDRKENKKLLLYAYLNAWYETGFTNPIDECIRQIENPDIAGYTKCDEVPYDFIRKRLSVVVGFNDRHIMVTKGSFKTILKTCCKVENSFGVVNDIDGSVKDLESQFDEFSMKGFRVIAVSYKDVTGDPVINKDDEEKMIFLGFLIFSDPIKKGMNESIEQLKKKGIVLKIITGDNYHVAGYLAQQINLTTDEVLTGEALHNLTSEALARKTETVNVFAEILPAQKERIIKALQKNGHTVGYLGDGINDANALKAADVGISINNAVDVAKEAADLVLLDQDINVIREGVEEGRKTFANTLKYIFVTTSANFGNMFSMAIASLLLPFLPLLPIQILLNNFLSDLPAIAIASDTVDEELVVKPRKWNMHYIWRFMILFGLQSSFFDFATFGLLFYVFHASPGEFRTAWFMESLLTEILILLVIRTQRPFFKSQPSRYLTLAAIVTFTICLVIPYLPFATIFELYPMPLPLFGCVIVIITVYILVAEVSKKYLLKRL